jgi:hypothetical protein
VFPKRPVSKHIYRVSKERDQTLRSYQVSLSKKVLHQNIHDGYGITDIQINNSSKW